MVENDKRTWRRFGILVACVLAGLVAVGIIVDQLLLPAIVGASDVVSVPQLAGKPIEQASALLEQQGLVLVSPREQYSDKVPKGRVMSQLPYAGAQVKEGRRIYVTVSKGIETVEMPDVRGQLMRDARLSLMRLGLTLGDVQYEPSDSIPAHRILAQGIKPGSAVPYGASCSIVISKGPSSSMVPDVRSMSLDEATAVLLQRGFTLGNVQYRPSTAFMVNTVVDQSPAPETSVPPATPVDLTVVRP